MYERQRVWRACQACRKKKVKCDWEHPCWSCTRNKAEERVYVEPHSNMRLVDPHYVMKLESRISLMEQRLRQQSSMVETRKDAVQSDKSNESVLSDRENIEHHSRLRGDQSANAVDRGALPDLLVGCLGESSVDAAVQTPQQRSMISLLRGDQFNEDVMSDSGFDLPSCGSDLPGHNAPRRAANASTHRLLLSVNLPHFPNHPPSQISPTARSVVSRRKRPYF